MTGTKVDSHLGHDINFDPRDGKFSTQVGGEYHKGKTIVEVQKQIEAFIARKSERMAEIPVLQFQKPARPEPDERRNTRNYRGPDYFTEVNDFTVKGIEVERGRGRGATTTVYFKTNRGSRGANQTFYRPNDEAKAEFDEVMKEWRESNLAFYNKALDALDKFQVYPGTEIFDDMLNGPPGPTKLKVVS